MGDKGLSLFQLIDKLEAEIGLLKSQRNLAGKRCDEMAQANLHLKKRISTLELSNVDMRVALKKLNYPYGDSPTSDKDKEKK